MVNSCLLRLLADIGQDTAVNVQNMSVDEVGRVGSQEHGRSLQILGLAPASGRRLRDDELIKGMTAASGLDLTPVSYTHLDVYKRQHVLRGIKILMVEILVKV